MNPNEEFDKSDPRVYPNRPRWMRMATILAGPAANYLTAFVLTLFVLLAFGVPSKTQKILEPVAGRPAAVAGMKAGDVLVDANGQAVDAEHPITEVIRVAGQAGGHQGPARRQAARFPGRGGEQGGRFRSGSDRAIDERTPIGVPGALKEAVVYPYYASVGILEGLYGMVRGKVHADLSGPIGITQQIAQAASRGPVDFLGILILLSVYLGLFNLLPVPALDGGRAVFLTIESVMRKKVNPRIEAAVHTAGFLLLLGVLLVVSFKDIFGKG